MFVICLNNYKIASIGIITKLKLKKFKYGTKMYMDISLKKESWLNGESFKNIDDYLCVQTK